MLIERVARAAKTHTPVGDLSDIPNLTWKDASGAIRINPLSWVPDDMDAISLDYAYPMKGVLRHHDMTSYLPMKGWLSYPVTASLTCRGCARNCATCGGEKGSKRDEMKELMKQFRSTSDVIESNIFQSVHNINLRTVIGYHKDDEEYNFLDDYNER